MLNNQTAKLRASRKKHLNEVMASAIECLESDLFVKYRGLYEKYEREIQSSLLEYPVNDPEYKNVCIKYLSELGILRKLLKEVIDDSGK